MNDVYFLAKSSEIEQMIVGAIGKALETFSEKKENENLLTSREAEKMLKVSKPTLHKLKQRGLIPFVQVGNSIRYRESDIREALLARGGDQ